MAYLGDYWVEITMYKINALLKIYEDLFPQSFTELRGIKGILG